MFVLFPRAGVSFLIHSPSLALFPPSLTSQAYSSSSLALVPSEVLYSMWGHADHLAGTFFFCLTLLFQLFEFVSFHLQSLLSAPPTGYEQQDAHEFFISLADGIHDACGGTFLIYFVPFFVVVVALSPSPFTRSPAGCHSLTHKVVVLFTGKTHSCTCVVHTTFGGKLRSDVICSNCQNVSTTTDPIFDLSLDLRRPSEGIDEGVHSLSESLSRFTHPETLGRDDKFLCSKCQVYDEASKKISLEFLPHVLCIHLKRFEHSLTNKGSKIDTYVSFPEILDMSSYLHQEDETQVPEPKLFELYCVVVHIGSLDKGHYIAYVKRGDCWFLCDDTEVICVPKTEVLSSRA